MDAVGNAMCQFAQAAFGTIEIGMVGSGLTAAITFALLGLCLLMMILGIAGLITKNLGITSFFEISKFFGGDQGGGYGRADSILQAAQENGLTYTLAGMVGAVFHQYLGPLVALAIKAIIVGAGSALGGSCTL